MLTEFDAEPIPDEEGRPLNDPTCHAVALAPFSRASLGIRLHPAARIAHPVARVASYPEPTVAEIAACIDAAHRGLPSRWACWLPWGGRVELRLAAADCRLLDRQEFHLSLTRSDAIRLLA